MKKQLLFMAIAGLFTSIASAADLYVRDLGAGGSYSTISAAITAASDGDRIIIRPKAASLPYIENLTIDKSVTLVSEINFSKYVLQGTITITPLAGRVVTLHNVSSNFALSVSAATTGGRTTLNVYNSLFSSITADKANTSLNMSGCTTSTVALSHGRCTANTCQQFAVNGTALESNPTTEDIEIIANNITSGGAGIVINQRNYAFRLLNNFLPSGNISVNLAKNGSSNEIRNNVINYGTYSALYIDVATGNSATFMVLNNELATSSTTGSYAEIHNNNTATATVYAFNNISASTFTTIGTIAASGNIGNVTLSINSSTYTVTGTGVVNGGAIDDEYADIDLTRNDIGNFGGSDSWANYWPTAVGNKPQVNYLNTPRRIYTGTTEMNATGSGYSK
jgi:hypothetical protein